MENCKHGKTVSMGCDECGTNMNTIEMLRPALSWSDALMFIAKQDKLLRDKDKQIEELKKENEEQARLLGMSGEREAALLGKLERSRNMIRILVSSMREVNWRSFIEDKPEGIEFRALIKEAESFLKECEK